MKTSSDRSARRDPYPALRCLPSNLAILVLTTAVVAPTALTAGEEHEAEIRVVEVEHVVECDGSDCDAENRSGRQRTLFVDDEERVHGLLSELRAGGDELDDRVVRLLHASLPDLSGGGYLGIGLSDLTPELRAHFGLPTDAGVMVSRVIDDSPAFRAGIAVGDVLYSVDGEPVESARQLRRTIRSHDEHTIVDLEVWREGSPLLLTATLETPAETPLSSHGRRVRVHCDGDENCEVNVSHAPLGDHSELCGDEAHCQIRVECTDEGSCDCSVQGESIDCGEIQGVPGAG